MITSLLVTSSSTTHYMAISYLVNSQLTTMLGPKAGDDMIIIITKNNVEGRKLEAIDSHKSYFTDYIHKILT